MKIFIALNIKETPYGGSHIFLRTLRNYFRKNDQYTDNSSLADVILFDSCQNIPTVLSLKKKFPEKLFIHRIDGPIQLYNNEKDLRDRITYLTDTLISDATIFQSYWSMNKNYMLSLKKNNFHAVIRNASDPSIFNNNAKVQLSNDKKIRIISSSWSSNWKKGFDVYKWLDDNLNFNFFEMTFVGNTPVRFSNINHISVVDSKEISNIIKKHDIYITASHNDPCSNSLIEALSCGLPAIARNEGGHPEIIGKGGELFDQPHEIPTLLNTIANNYETYQQLIQQPTIDEIGKKYYEFINNIYQATQLGEYLPKKLTQFSYLKLFLRVFFWRLQSKVVTYFNNVISS